MDSEDSEACSFKIVAAFGLIGVGYRGLRAWELCPQTNAL
jgi:hypothetical protein